jgi:hypothetical protein
LPLGATRAQDLAFGLSTGRAQAERLRRSMAAFSRGDAASISGAGSATRRAAAADRVAGALTGSSGRIGDPATGAGAHAPRSAASPAVAGVAGGGSQLRA